MRSPIFLLLFVSVASGTIYWFVEKPAVKKVQLQSDLILHSTKKQNIALLYDLIPFGQDIDRYLKDHHLRVQSVKVKLAEKVSSGKIKAIVDVSELRQPFGHKKYMAQFELSPSRNSPTGYTLSKGSICKDSCLEEVLKFGFTD